MRALAASRIHRAADVLPPGHEIQVDVGPPARVGGPVERLLGLARASRVCTQPIRLEMRCTCVSTQMCCRLWNARIITSFAVLRPTPGSVTSSSSVRGHLAAESLDERLAVCLHEPRLVAVEAHRVDQLLDLLHAQLRHASAASARAGTAASRPRASSRPACAPRAGCRSGSETDPPAGSRRSSRSPAAPCRRSRAPACASPARRRRRQA